MVGGKALASWIPYTIISFELMVLIGGLSTVAGLFVAGRLPKIITTVRVRLRGSASTSYGFWPSVLAPDRAQDDRGCAFWRCGGDGGAQ